MEVAVLEARPRFVLLLLGWSDADLVHVAYGKICFPSFLASNPCLFVIYKQCGPGLWETWVWRVALTGYVLAYAGRLCGLLDAVIGNYNALFEVGWIITSP
jgi:hypothetical protein